jgi:hypothetical protein
MDINELKQIIKNQTNVLVMENGKPEFVVMDYEYFRKITGKDSEPKLVQPQSPVSPHRDLRSVQPTAFNPAGESRTLSKDQEILERLNNEILALKNQIEQEEQKGKEVNID